jgi:hypothetical protein
MAIQEAGAALASFADTMIPGDGEFPPASATGAVALLAARLDERAGPGAAAAFAALLDRVAGGSFAALPEADREQAVAAIERDAPDLFLLARMALYYSYYEQPAVVEVIRALGFTYNDAPLPHGYRMLAFDPAPAGTAPLVNVTGAYKRTDAISRVDLGPLAEILAAELGR